MAKKGTPKRDGSGRGTRANRGRGGCETTSTEGQLDSFEILMKSFFQFCEYFFNFTLRQAKAEDEELKEC